jgi:predicted regulator of Ras-like GTPase activity (Roadblock/LC7/MglB family)
MPIASNSHNMPSPDSESRGLLRRLSNGNPDIAAVLLVDGDGQVHASDAADPRLVQVATALVVPLREMLDRAAAELGCGALLDTFVTGEHACFALADVDGNRSVIIIGASASSPGALRSDARLAAESVRAGEALT